MRKKVILETIFLLVMHVVFAERSHLHQLTHRYPYGLIGDDYGILTEEDLVINANSAIPDPFGSDNRAYSYWKCFSISRSRCDCESLGYDAISKNELTYYQIHVLQGDEINVYLARDPMDVKDCKKLQKSWIRLTKGQKNVCLSGIYNGISKSSDSKNEIDWVFDRFKTRKGCQAHKSECSLTNQSE